MMPFFSRSRGAELTPEMKALLEAGKTVPVLPPNVKARAVNRARASLAYPVNERQVPPIVARGWSFRFALAAGVVGLSMVALVAAAALKLIGPRSQHTGGESSGPTGVILRRPAEAPANVDVTVPARDDEARSAAPTSVTAPSPVAPVRAARASRGPVSRDEILLLRRARAAVAAQSFAHALKPLDEHGRRFKTGRLAEEREALRVKALAGLGRTEEARRVAAAFAVHFPKSPLLPVVEKVSGSAP